MKPQPLHQKAAALGLAALFTLTSAATLNASLQHSHSAPAQLLAVTDVGCELDPTRSC